MFYCETGSNLVKQIKYVTCDQSRVYHAPHLKLAEIGLSSPATLVQDKWYRKLMNEIKYVCKL